MSEAQQRRFFMWEHYLKLIGSFEDLEKHHEQVIQDMQDDFKMPNELIISVCEDFKEFKKRYLRGELK